MRCCKELWSLEKKDRIVRHYNFMTKKTSSINV